MVISNPLKNFFTKFTKKSYKRNKNMSKSEISAFFRQVFANNFFCTFWKIFQRIWNHREILRFFVPFLFC